MIKGQLADLIYKKEMEKIRKQIPGIILSDVRPSRERAQKVLTDPEVWFEKFVSEGKLTYEYKMSKIILDGSPVKDDEFTAHISIYLLRNQVKITKSQIKDVLIVWKLKQEKGFLERLKLSTKFVVTEQDVISDWVWAVTGKRDKLDVAIVKHFVWQIKRKIHSLPVENHLMPVLFGKSGGGKSVAVSKLLEPLQAVTLNSDMGLIEDQLFKKGLGRNFIVFFDELAGSNKVDVNRLKQIITADRMEWRGIRSENMVSGSQNCTFIGCSNIPVVSRIQDPTSMRRFWQLGCKDKINWEVVNGLNYSSLWASINEKEPSPILPHLSKIKKLQEGMR